MCEEESVKYLRDLIKEKEEVEKNGKDILVKLLSQEIVRVRGGGRPPGKDTRLLDVYNEKPVRVTAKVAVPVKEHPRFNFVGKLLGPKGNSLKGLQEETMTKIAILGKGSMKDKLKEQQLRNSSDPKHIHLQEDLHVEITAFSSPAEAHARIAYALSCVRKYMIPDSNDEIRQKQMREIQILKKLETIEDIVSDPKTVSESDSSTSPDPSQNHNNLPTNSSNISPSTVQKLNHPSLRLTYNNNNFSTVPSHNPHNTQDLTCSGTSHQFPNSCCILQKINIQRNTNFENENLTNAALDTNPQRHKEEVSILEKILPSNYSGIRNKRQHGSNGQYLYECKDDDQQYKGPDQKRNKLINISQY